MIKIARTGKYPYKEPKDSLPFPERIYKLEEILEDDPKLEKFYQASAVLHLLQFNAFDITEEEFFAMIERGEIIAVKFKDEHWYIPSRFIVKEIFGYAKTCT